MNLYVIENKMIYFITISFQRKEQENGFYNYIVDINYKVFKLPFTQNSLAFDYLNLKNIDNELSINYLFMQNICI